MAATVAPAVLLERAELAALQGTAEVAALPEAAVSVEVVFFALRMTATMVTPARRTCATPPMGRAPTPRLRMARRAPQTETQAGVSVEHARVSASSWIAATATGARETSAILPMVAVSIHPPATVRHVMREAIRGVARWVYVWAFVQVSIAATARNVPRTCAIGQTALATTRTDQTALSATSATYRVGVSLASAWTRSFAAMSIATTAIPALKTCAIR